MRNKKILLWVCGAAAVTVTVILLIWNIVLTVKLNKARELYAEQTAVNEQLAAMTGSESEAPNEEQLAERGVKTGIPDEIYDKIFGTTLFADSPVKRENLVYLTVPYCNFTGERAIGHMIVNKRAAEDVLDIFEELYRIKYPIEKMELAEEFDSMQSALLNSTELASMGSNNTCALYYSTENGEFSPHSFGIAIDINPKINPSRDIYGAPVPKNAGRYANNEGLTETEKAAKITEESEICKIFAAHGWTWDSSEPCCFIKN